MYLSVTKVMARLCGLKAPIPKLRLLLVELFSSNPSSCNTATPINRGQGDGGVQHLLVNSEMKVVQIVQVPAEQIDRAARVHSSPSAHILPEEAKCLSLPIAIADFALPSSVDMEVRE